jgi:acetyl-CoA acyltransferase 1
MLFASSFPLRRAIFPATTRFNATLGGGTSILDKNSDDVVITFAKRTAIGRAKKGQFKDTPVDELLHALFKVYKKTFYLSVVKHVFESRLRSRKQS